MSKRAQKQAVRAAREVANTLTVHVPLAIRKRGSRKVLIMPGDGAVISRPQNRIDSAVVKALARAHRWKRMLESGEFGSITELAAAERVNHSYVCRMLRLNLLAPEIVERLLNGVGCLPEVQELCRPFSVEWQRQVTAFSPPE
jgi:hypothetical protein